MDEDRYEPIPYETKETTKEVLELKEKVYDVSAEFSDWSISIGNRYIQDYLCYRNTENDRVDKNHRLDVADKINRLFTQIEKLFEELEDEWTNDY